MSTGDGGQGHGDFLRSVIDAALDAVIVMDARGRVVHWNKQAETIFGWTRGEAIGRPLAALVIPPRYREAHTAGLRRFLETGAGPVLNRRVELAAVHRDGREFPVELTVTPFRLGDGVAFTGFIRDITERQQARERLERQLLEAQLLHQATTLAAASASFEEALRQCLEIVCRMTGWPAGHAYVPAQSKDELVPTGIWHPAEAGAHAAFRAATERTRLPRGVGLPGRVWRSGEPEWIEDLLPGHDGFPRAHLLPELGLRTGFAFPVKAGGERLARGAAPRGRRRAGRAGPRPPGPGDRRRPGRVRRPDRGQPGGAGGGGALGRAGDGVRGRAVLRPGMPRAPGLAPAAEGPAGARPEGGPVEPATAWAGCKQEPEPGFPGWIGRWLTSGPNSSRGIRELAAGGPSDRRVRDG